MFAVLRVSDETTAVGENGTDPSNLLDGTMVPSASASS